MALNYLLKEYKGANTVNFPDPDRDPKEKNQYEYILQTLKGMYSAFAREKTGITPTRQEKFRINRLYGKGDQPTEYYKNVLINKNDRNVRGIKGGTQLAEHRRKSWQNLDFEHKVTYAPKVESHFYGLFLDVEQDVIGHPVDKDSGAEMKSKKLRMITELKWFDQLKAFREKTGQKEPDWDFFPKDKAELDLFEASEGFKLNHAKTMEKLLSHVFSKSGWERLKKHYVSDVINTGYVIGKIKDDSDTDETLADYVDPEYAIVQHSNYWDYRDIEYVGELKPMTISELSKKGLSDNEIVEVAKKYSGFMGNPGREFFHNKTVRPEDVGHFKVVVLEGFFKDYEDEYRKEYINPYGKKRLIDVPYGSKPKNNNSKISVTRNWYVYKGNWVVGSDIMFDYGKAYNQLKEDKETRLPYGVFKLDETTITERLIPLYDQLEIGWLKFQNAQAQASTSGHAINMRLLSNVQLGGNPVDPIDALLFMKETGDMIYSDVSMNPAENYKGGEVTPVHNIEGGMRLDLQEGIQKFEWTIRMIEHITGLSEVAMGTPPSGDSQVGTTQMAVSGTQNIIQPNFATIMFLKGKLAKEAMFSIQTKIKHNEQVRDYYEEIAGQTAINTLLTATKRGAKYGIHYRPRPTEKQKQELKAMIDNAISGKVLSPDEGWMLRTEIDSGANLKDLGLKLAYKIQRREQEMTRKEFAARQQQHRQNMEYEQMQFRKESTLKQMEIEGKLKEEQMQQSGENQRQKEKMITEFQELTERIKQDMREMLSEERQKIAEITKQS
jgi:hypothetical protein